MTFQIFQSTPPVKAATYCKVDVELSLWISIHAAREGGDIQWFSRFHPLRSISIHAAREGGDRKAKKQLQIINISIHAAREGGDYRDPVERESQRISIHAAREGGDIIRLNYTQ